MGNSPERVDQGQFVNNANYLIEQAQAPETSLATSLNNAQYLQNQLDAISMGRLVVEPPLSDEQIGQFKNSSELIINLGEKARTSRETAETTSKTSRKFRRKGKKPEEAPTTPSTFSGNASSSKSY